MKDSETGGATAALPADPIAVWRIGLDALCAADPDLARIVAEAGPPLLELRGAGFGALLRAIIAQQVSAAAARSIWGRVSDAVQPLTPEAFLALSEAEIRAFGFGRPKIAYARGLAEALASGALDLDAVARMPDEEALAALVRLKGIGRWSAEVFLLFALGRPDVFPSQDLALAVAVQRIKGLEQRPGHAGLSTIAQQWRPWRSVAAILLWHYYRTAP